MRFDLLPNDPGYRADNKVASPMGLATEEEGLEQDSGQVCSANIHSGGTIMRYSMR